MERDKFDRLSTFIGISLLRYVGMGTIIFLVALNWSVRRTFAIFPDTYHTARNFYISPNFCSRPPKISSSFENKQQHTLKIISHTFLELQTSATPWYDLQWLQLLAAEEMSWYTRTGSTYFLDSSLCLNTCLVVSFFSRCCACSKDLPAWDYTLTTLLYQPVHAQ